jgi:hypothetical protein
MRRCRPRTVRVVSQHGLRRTCLINLEPRFHVRPLVDAGSLFRRLTAAGDRGPPRSDVRRARRRGSLRAASTVPRAGPPYHAVELRVRRQLAARRDTRLRASHTARRKPANALPSVSKAGHIGQCGKEFTDAPQSA